jgi:hypothetical protein
VPLTTRTELWRDYWEPALPHVAGATWPTLPSPGLRAAGAAALRSALAFVTHVRPHLRVCAGQVLWLSENLALSPEATLPTPRAKDIFGPACLPWELRSYCTTTPAPATQVTVAVGSLERLVNCFAQLKKNSGRDRVRDVWPQLAVVFYTRHVGRQTDAAALRAELGDDVLLLELGVLREGVVAVEDPRYGLPRLLTEHGVYCEFLPTSEMGKPAPVRLGLEQIETGVPYEVVLTSAAGLWACRSGMAVCFERRDPPLLRFVEMPVPASQEARPITLPAHPALNPPIPRPRSAGTPAARPESFAHNPWLIPVDRG